MDPNIEVEDIISVHSVNSDEEGSNDKNHVKFPPFAQFQPHDIEFTSIFPSYPKSHVNGHATVVELNNSVTNEDAVMKLRNGMQYSLTKGHGK